MPAVEVPVEGANEKSGLSSLMRDGQAQALANSQGRKSLLLVLVFGAQINVERPLSVHLRLPCTLPLFAVTQRSSAAIVCKYTWFNCYFSISHGACSSE